MRPLALLVLVGCGGIDPVATEDFAMCEELYPVWHGAIVGRDGTSTGPVDGFMVGDRVYELVLTREDSIDSGYNGYGLFTGAIGEPLGEPIHEDRQHRRLQRSGDLMVWVSGPTAGSCCHTLMTMPFDGAEPTRLLTVSEMDDVVIEGEHAYLSAFDYSASGIHEVNLFTGASRRIAEHTTDEELHLDATHVYYVTASSSDSRIFRVPRAGGPEEMVRLAPGALAMAVTDDHLYWLDATSLWRAAKDSVGEAEYVRAASADQSPVWNAADAALAVADDVLYAREPIGDFGERLVRTDLTDDSTCVLWDSTTTQLRGFWIDPAAVSWYDTAGHLWRLPRYAD